MIVRDLYRCPPEDLHQAIASSAGAVLRRGVVEPASAIEPGDVDYLVRHPDFDPSLSFVAYDGQRPVAYLVSRIEGEGEGAEAVWSLFGGAAEMEHGLEMALADAVDRWRQEGAARARRGLTGLLGSAVRTAEDGAVVEVLKGKDFEVAAQGAEMALELKKLTGSGGAAEREAELRRKGYLVRPARPDEVAVVARQYHPRHTGWLSLEFWNLVVRHLRPEALAVLEHRRQLIGYAAYLGWTLEADSPSLGPVFVEPVHRRTGLGGVLLRQALLAMKAAGKAGVRTVCEPSRVASYERVGFAVASRFCHEVVAELE